MKRLSKLITVIFMALLLTGCAMKVNYNIEVTKDKKVTLGMLIAYDDDLLDNIISNNKGLNTKTYTNEERWNYLEENLRNNDSYKNFKSEKYEEGNFKGYIFYTDKININDVSSEEKADRFNLSSDFELLDEKVLFIKDGKKYISNIKVSENDTGQEKEYKDRLGTNLEAKVIVILPVKSISNNATSVSTDGKTLTWELKNNGTENIDFEFQFSGFPWLLILFVISAVTFTILIIYFANIKKIDTKEEAPKEIEHKDDDNDEVKDL